MSSYTSSVGTPQRERLDEDAGREEELLAVGGLTVSVEAEKCCEIRRMLLGGGGPCERGDRIGELLRGFGGVVAVEDARDLLHLLTERAVRAATRRRGSSDRG